MKPTISKRLKTNAPSLKVSRHKLLSRIQVANFPADAGKFKESELRETGLWDKYTQPEDMGSNSFKLLVLLATQAKEIREELAYLRKQVAELKPYHSPLWLKTYGEPDPLKRDEIMRQAKADEARVAAERASKRQALEDSIQKFGESIGRKQWDYRDERHEPYAAVFWHEPMTVMDYHKATGITRRTIMNVLQRLAAKPLAKRDRTNAPAKYGVETNFAILREWLVRYEKQPENRRAWLVQTLLKYKHQAPEHFNAIIEAVLPVLESLGINTEDKIKRFMAYFRQCEHILYPPPPAIPGLYQLLGFSPESSVGKTG